jgi:diguanylate cyclase (GGDEF)-like protein
MTQNVVNLLIVLVAANIILISVAVARSLYRRRRLRFAGPRPSEEGARMAASDTGHAPAGLSFDALAAVTRTDALTGLLLPGEWNRIVTDEDARILRYGHPATVVLIEVDGLDRLVGVLGHDAGDRILPAVADTLSRNARGADHLARLGPARFGVLLPETGEVEAINYIERIRLACDLWLESSAVALRLSIGWASPAAARSLTEAVSAAQERMYEEQRRNTRRTTDVQADGPPPMQSIEGSPSPA